MGSFERGTSKHASGFDIEVLDFPPFPFDGEAKSRKTVFAEITRETFLTHASLPLLFRCRRLMVH